MEFIKCKYCGMIYKTSLDNCPQCGCFTYKQPQMPTIDNNAPVDLKKVFEISEDSQHISIEYLQFNCSIAALCDELSVLYVPHIVLHCFIKDGVPQLKIGFDEDEFLARVSEEKSKALTDKYCSPCKRMIIKIDGEKDIKLNLEEGCSGLVHSYFPISNELFLACCNAKELEFKIIKESRTSIVIKGYYEYDYESGAEIDFFGEVVPENEIVLDFQALYNYSIDSKKFKNAIRKKQMIREWSDAKYEAEKTAELEAKSKIFKRKILFGCMFGIGVIISIIGVWMVMSTNNADDLLFPFIVMFGGFAMFIVGGYFMLPEYVFDGSRMPK